MASKIIAGAVSIFDIEIGGCVGSLHGHEIATGAFKDWEVSHSFEVPKETFVSMYNNLKIGKPYCGKMGYIVSATEDIDGNASALLIVYEYDGGYRIGHLIAPQWKNII